MPRDYLRITSGLGEAAPATVVVFPVVFEEQVLGVVELASFRPFSPVHMQFLEQLMEIIGVSLNAIIASSRTEELLVESQRLAAELQDKSEELQSQQEELQQTNAELEEKARLLAEQNRAIEIKNLEIEDARRGLEDRAEQLALSSRYKSEFLANMSHELRTPLNSLLILAKLLSDNPDGNLDRRQVEYSRTIHSAGTDLLQLINDILDLSKVEAGKMDVHAADVAVSGVVEYVEATFRPLTAEKDLRFQVTVEDDVPRSAPLRPAPAAAGAAQPALQRREVHRHGRGTAGHPDWPAAKRFNAATLRSAEQVIAFSVIDTGIGIPAEQLRIIFEAFQQADGTISRKFGGTGLGLSISREIARLIGGEIHVESEPGAGSTFTLYLPVHGGVTSALAASVDGDATEEVISAAPAAGPVLDDETVSEGDIEPGDRVLLVALSDPELRRAAVERGAQLGLRTLATTLADNALRLARKHGPVGIVVGAELTLHEGSALLERLKSHPDTRHIPAVAVLSGTHAEAAHRSRLAGAFDVLEEAAPDDRLDAAIEGLARFADQPRRSLLVVTGEAADDATRVADSAAALFGALHDVDTRIVRSAEEAYAALADRGFDCVVARPRSRRRTAST